jgi:hypothetical protein
MALGINGGAGASWWPQPLAFNRPDDEVRADLSDVDFDDAGSISSASKPASLIGRFSAGVHYVDPAIESEGVDKTMRVGFSSYPLPQLEQPTKYLGLSAASEKKPLQV